jgi:mono/diheme cytochrome c family protein
MLLGEVPVEADGSAYFRAPARKLLYFQAVDGSGKAVQTMRSATYLQPGERQGCVGCHAPAATAAATGGLLALKRPASIIEPGPEGTRPLSFPRLVQPVLDRHCVRCHAGGVGPGKSRLLLTGEPAGGFSRSYENLRPFVRWYEWGDKSIANIVTVPGHAGADESSLLKVLEDHNHAGEIRLAADDRRRLILWLDANAPFYGTYLPEEQQAQRRGQSVPLPRLQ